MICAKDGCAAPAASRQKYCTWQHAPLAGKFGPPPQNEVLRKVVQSRKIRPVKSGMPAPGELPRESSAEENPTANESGSEDSIPLLVLEDEKLNDSTTRKIAIASTAEIEPATARSQSRYESRSPNHGWNDEELQAKLHAEHGGTGMSEIENDTLRTKDADGTSGTQVALFPPPSKDLSPGSLISMSLIDESATHLHGLMKSLSADSHPSKKLDPQVIRAAVSCASEVRNLMRLKFDVMKESRRNP